jgi:hypothetical protein
MGNLERALKFPFSGEGWAGRFILGGSLCALASLLSFIPFLGWLFWILVSLAPLGYAYGVFDDRLAARAESLPVWRAWGDLVYRGFFVFLVVLVYGLAPAVLYGVGGALWTAGGFAALFGVPFLVLGAGIGLAVSFLLPMAFARYAEEGEFFPAVFRWSRIVEKIWIVQKDYFFAWLAGLILFLALLFLRSHILFLGWILYSFGFFYFLLVAARLFGDVCREGAGEEFQ